MNQEYTLTSQLNNRLWLVVHLAITCGQKSFKLEQRCHLLLSGSQPKATCPEKACCQRGSDTSSCPGAYTMGRVRKMNFFPSFNCMYYLLFHILREHRCLDWNLNFGHFASYASHYIIYQPSPVHLAGHNLQLNIAYTLSYFLYRSVTSNLGNLLT